MFNLFICPLPAAIAMQDNRSRSRESQPSPPKYSQFEDFKPRLYSNVPLSFSGLDENHYALFFAPENMRFGAEIRFYYGDILKLTMQMGPGVVYIRSDLSVVETVIDPSMDSENAYCLKLYLPLRCLTIGPIHHDGLIAKLNAEMVGQPSQRVLLPNGYQVEFTIFCDPFVAVLQPARIAANRYRFIGHGIPCSTPILWSDPTNTTTLLKDNPFPPKQMIPNFLTNKVGDVWDNYHDLRQASIKSYYLSFFFHISPRSFVPYIATMSFMRHPAPGLPLALPTLASNSASSSVSPALLSFANEPPITRAEYAYVLAKISDIEGRLAVPPGESKLTEALDCLRTFRMIESQLSSRMESLEKSSEAGRDGAMQPAAFNAQMIAIENLEKRVASLEASDQAQSRVSENHGYGLSKVQEHVHELETRVTVLREQSPTLETSVKVCETRLAALSERQTAFEEMAQTFASHFQVMRDQSERLTSLELRVDKQPEEFKAKLSEFQSAWNEATSLLASQIQNWESRLVVLEKSPDRSSIGAGLQELINGYHEIKAECMKMGDCVEQKCATLLEKVTECIVNCNTRYNEWESSCGRIETRQGEVDDRTGNLFSVVQDLESRLDSYESRLQLDRMAERVVATDENTVDFSDAPLAAAIRPRIKLIVKKHNRILRPLVVSLDDTSSVSSTTSSRPKRVIKPPSRFGQVSK